MARLHLGAQRRSPARAACAAFLLALSAALAGCASLSDPLGYYWQSATGHLRLMAAARPVDDWLQDPAATPRLKERLQLARRIRAFASRELALPANPSYTRYADLGRPAAVWNVVAAPALSLELRTWCFPVTGCVGYRGWFDEAQAQREAEALRAQGWDATAYPVPAYSTLGWMNWAGGDPLLNTFIGYSPGELARLIFHELAHQVLYAKDDTVFNESFATAVERLGVARWLDQEADDAIRRDYAEGDRRREQFRALKRSTRAQLADLYRPVTQAEAASSARAASATASATDERLARKQAILASFRAEYLRLRQSWGGEPGRFRLTDRWVEAANNASFGAEAAYDELVPGFEALFAREGGDWRRFYDAAARLAELPRPERHQRLKELALARPANRP